jgi:hypothetical protein
LCSFCSSLTMKPKTNQQITTYTNHFPSYQKCDQIICSHLNLHRSSKKTQITQKTRLVRISLHIAHAINMNTKTHESHGHHHRSSECVKTQKPINSHCMCTKPGRQRNHDRRSLEKNLIKNKKTQKGACSQPLNCHNSTTTCTKPSTHLAC